MGKRAQASTKTKDLTSIPQDQPEGLTVNVEHYAEVDAALRLIVNHKCFEDILEAEPLDIYASGEAWECGKQAVFNYDDYKKL